MTELTMRQGDRVRHVPSGAIVKLCYFDTDVWKRDCAVCEFPSGRRFPIWVEMLEALDEVPE